MDIQHNFSLKGSNTFGIDVPAAYYVEINSLIDLVNVSSLPYPKYVIGAGSNILLKQEIEGLVIKSNLSGITILKSTPEFSFVQAHSGENWHSLVLYAIDKGLGGIENLALIPGNVGAAPIQNIGAYGVEVKDVVYAVVCWHWELKKVIVFNNEACKFGYRDSIFKNELKGKVFVISVILKLFKNPVIHTSYGTITDELNKYQVVNPTIKDVAEAVIRIRQSKLPDVKITGNAGSFFKNPVINRSFFEQLQTEWPEMPYYHVNNEQVKIPAGWLIEQCRWKGYRNNNCGVHDKQALVLINFGDSTGTEIWDLSESIIRSVQERYAINLEREVEVWP